MDTLLVLLIIALLLVCIGGFTLLFLRRGKESAGVSHEVMRTTQEQFILLAREKLGAEGAVMRQEFERRKDSISELIGELRKDLTHGKERLERSEQERTASFSAVQKELEMHKSLMHELRGTTDELRKVLSNNQLRGAFGEQVAENLLKMAGFVVGQDYVINKEQESVDTRPDFTLFLPDGSKVNIDVKFPYASLIKFSSTENKQEREGHLRQFTQDVKTKVKQVAGREYINPEERTVDFVILFIPNEMIFSFIYDQLHEVWEEAMVKKVIFAGPFSFTAILRMVKQAHASFHYQANIHQVIGLIGKFENEYGKFSESLDRLGDRIDSMKKQYDEVSGARTRVLGRVIDQIKNQEVGQNEGIQKIE